MLHLIGWFIWIVWWCTDLQTLNLRQVPFLWHIIFQVVINIVIYYYYHYLLSNNFEVNKNSTLEVTAVCAFSERTCLSTTGRNKHSFFPFGIVLVNISSNFFRVLVMRLANICLGFVVVLIVCLVKSGPTLSSLGAFAKFRKATIGFIVSIRRSVRPHGISRLPLEGFSLTHWGRGYLNCLNCLNARSRGF